MNISKRSVSSTPRYQQLQSYLQSDPDNPYLHAELIEIALKNGEKDLAWSYAQQAAYLIGQNSQLLYWCNTVALTVGCYEAAVAHLLPRLESNHLELWQCHNLMYGLLHQGFYNKIIEIADEHIALVQSDSACTLLLARAYHLSGVLTKADALLNAYETQNSEEGSIFAFHSLIKLDLGDNDSARLLAERAIGLDGGAIEAQITMGALAISGMHAKEADKYAVQVLQHDETCGRGHLIRAQACLLLQNAASAVQHFNAAVRFMPTHQGSYLGLAWSYLLNNQLEYASEAFDHALRIDGNFSEAHAGVALCALQKNERALCRHHNQRALRLDPLSITGRYVDALLMAEDGRLTEAQATIEALMMFPVGVNVVPIQHMAQRYLQEMNNE